MHIYAYNGLLFNLDEWEGERKKGSEGGKRGKEIWKGRERGGMDGGRDGRGKRLTVEERDGWTGGRDG